MDIQITKEMQDAIAYIEETDKPIYITGKAGTGKTTLLKHLIKTSDKKFLIASPTGVAAINSGGMTLHSLFNIPFGPLDSGAADRSWFSNEKSKIFNSIDCLVIDEVSMVRPDVMDFIDVKLQGYRENNQPFGGVQIIMFGDLFQLPPVVKASDKNFLHEWYDGHNFFNANVFKHLPFKVVELTHVFRQTDQSFVNLLNHIREYKITPEDIDQLSELRDKGKADVYDNKYIHICTHKSDVASINNKSIGTHPERKSHVHGRDGA